VLVGGVDANSEGAELVRNFFGGKEPHKGVNPDEVVAVARPFRARCWPET